MVEDSENAAVEAAMRHRPAIIVSDVHLQSGGRSSAAVTRIREDYGFVPAVFVTGNLGDTEAHRLGWAVLAAGDHAVVRIDLFAGGREAFRSEYGRRWRHKG